MQYLNVYIDLKSKSWRWKMISQRKFGTKIIVILIVLVMLLSVPACQKPTQSGSSNADSGSDPQGSQPVTDIKMWGEWSSEAETQVNTMIGKFHSDHKSVQVEYLVVQDMVTKFLTASTSGQVPDVIIWDRFMTALYASKNVMYPIDDYIEQDGVDRNDFFPEALRELSYDGKTYGLPLTVDGWNLFINKKLFYILVT